MEANDFIVRLKANGTENDICDLHSVYDDYKVILKSLVAKDKSVFSMNVLCILCRNLDKVPTWKDSIDGKMLVTLSVDCVQETHGLQRQDQVKVLACIYHIHRHVTKLASTIPPELVLKLSSMPFECDTKSLLEEYCKTYWNILVDRISYIEKLKTKKSISKLLPKLMEDVLKVIHLYDSVQFCTNILTFLIKKLHFLYNNTNAQELHRCFGEIFKSLTSKTDLKSFRKLTEKELLVIYKNFNDCFYVIADSSKTKFENCLLSVVVRTAITVLGHSEDLMRCLETYFLNGFCSIFENLTNATNIENVLKNMIVSSLSMEKLGYEKSINATYTSLNQFLRLFIEVTVSNSKLDWNIYFNEKIQIACLNLMLFLSSKRTEQVVKCENCKVKSGLHDSLRLLFLIKHFPVTSINQQLNITNTLPIHYKVTTTLHKILLELKRLGCSNHDKCFRKLQTDVHNTAIVLNKASYYDYSIKLFDLYIQFEIRYFKDNNDLKNISRALYNKGICELDNKLYLEALEDAYLSLVFALPDGLKSEKYMSLVMDVKAKALKGYDGDQDGFQSMSVLDICKRCVEEKRYGNLKPFLVDLKFSEILEHEFNMYAKMWPSIVPIGGVWKSFYDLMEMPWMDDEYDAVKWTLFKVILKTNTVVRTVHNIFFSDVVKNLLCTLQNKEVDRPDLKFVFAALLFMQCEFDLAEASQKHGWKNTDTSVDIDQDLPIRTIPQEHEASKRAIKAVAILKEAVQEIETVGKPDWLFDALQLYQIYVMQLLQLCRTIHALQMAYICCIVAKHLCDSESFIRNAGVLLSHASSPGPEVMRLLKECSSLCEKVSLQTALCFMCDAALYYTKCGSRGVAARLVQNVQERILVAQESNPELNLDLATGRLLEAQAQLCEEINALSVASGVQKHYLSICNPESTWSSRRLVSLTLKVRISWSSVVSSSLCRRLLLWRRARGCALVGLRASGSLYQARLHETITNTHKMDDAQTKIDNRLKHILGLQPSYEPQLHRTEHSKPQLFTPRHENLETMLEANVFKKTQLSPSLPVYAYKMPDFFKHDKCDCSLCANPISFIIACATSGLESSMYYRAKEMDIARNYFDGTIKSFDYANKKIKSYFDMCKVDFPIYIIDMVEKIIENDFRKVQIDILIEAAFFELSNNEFERADDLIVRIHEILQEMTSSDPYVKSDVMNLMMTSAQMRKAVPKQIGTGLELEMEELKLSPNGETPKTPLNKRNQPPVMTKNIVTNEELPIVKRKVIKLNLDEAQEEQVSREPRKRAEFKIPVPVTTKPVIESITPRTRSKPDIFISKPTEDEATPKLDKNEFFTPKSTPSEEFFTPMTSVKTYSKKSLRNNIVKNLEAEFSTPKSDKENSTLNTDAELQQLPKTTGRSIRSKVDKRNLKRATSPGKLVKESKPTRSRLKKPANLNVNEDVGK